MHKVWPTERIFCRVIITKVSFTALRKTHTCFGVHLEQNKENILTLLLCPPLLWRTLQQWGAGTAVLPFKNVPYSPGSEVHHKKHRNYFAVDLIHCACVYLGQCQDAGVVHKFWQCLTLKNPMPCPACSRNTSDPGSTITVINTFGPGVDCDRLCAVGTFCSPQAALQHLH